DMMTQGMVGEPQRIDRRKDGEMGLELAGSIGLPQTRQQMMQRHGAGLLIGMQCCLQVNTGRRIVRAGSVPIEIGRGARRVRGDGGLMYLERHWGFHQARLASLSAMVWGLSFRVENDMVQKMRSTPIS